MATIVTVHGTFAHLGAPGKGADPVPADQLQWWQAGSPFERHLRKLVKAEEGDLDYVEFVWSGNNSEKERREAGTRLLALLRDLDAKGEKYVVVAHSHGGSVISRALVESVAKGKKLHGLQKWITIGTPFVDMKRERFLFSRLTGLQRVMFVASIMLLFMFLVYISGEIFSPRQRGDDYALRLAFSAAMMSLPFLFFYGLFRYLNRRSLFYYWPKALERAESAYGKQWLSLSHEDDEAVQGLRYVPIIKLNLIDRGFAVPALTTLAVFALPIAYLLIVNSPSTMVGIADFLKTRIYDVQKYENMETEVTAARQEIRKAARAFRKARKRANLAIGDNQEARDLQAKAESLRAKLRAKRRRFRKSYPSVPQVDRATRFRRRFLRQNGKPCGGGKLCGRGEDFRINSGLLFHVVTDELSSAFVSEDQQNGTVGSFARYAIPIVLVPLIFGVLAAAFLLLTRFFAGHISAGLSWILNRITHREIKRAAFGNDTEGEIAVVAAYKPHWIHSEIAFLPKGIADKITDFSNAVISKSLAKFRNAISTLAFSEAAENKADTISTYLTWKELIHTAYFEVPDFVNLVGFAIAKSDGFAETPALAAAPGRATLNEWLAALQPVPKTDQD